MAAGMQNHRVVSRGIPVVAPDRELEDGGDRQEGDQHVEPPPARGLSDAAHGLNVLQAAARRLLPRVGAPDRRRARPRIGPPDDGAGRHGS